jgi:hypothetical protein
MTTFKVGDKVKIRKLSEEEYTKIYRSSMLRPYSRYLSQYKNYFNCTGIVIKYLPIDNLVELKGMTFKWYPYELIKINSLKIRLQLIKELIK